MSRNTRNSECSRRALPSLAFSRSRNNYYFKASISPPTTSCADLGTSPTSQTSGSTTPSDRSLSPVSPVSSSSSQYSFSPITPPSSLSTSSFANCATPDWPNRDILAPLGSYCGSHASLHIADEDFLDLDLQHLRTDSSVSTYEEPEISWEQTKQPPVVLQAMPQVAKKPAPVGQRRRRSSPLKKKKVALAMSPITEAPE